MAEQDIGEFNLIITQADSSRLGEAAQKLTDAFSLDGDMAQQIVKSAPIVFASKLTKKEVKAITPTLQELSQIGLEFRITARLTQRLPKVNWPVRPQFTAGGISGSNGLAFSWDNNAFVCPGCGETFLFRRLGKLNLQEAEAVPAAAPVPTPAPRIAAVQRPVVSAPPPPKVEEPVEELSLSEPALEVSSAPLEDPISLELTDVPLAEPEMVPVDNGTELSEVPLELPEELPLAAEPAPEPVPTAVAAVPEEENGELYNVFLSKISDRAKQTKAAELIAKIKGCPPAEAQELSGRLVIPLAKNIGKNRAEQILEDFKKLKIFGRMTRAK